MARQIEPRLGEPRLAILDRRVAQLEVRIALLSEAVQVLIHDLEAQRPDAAASPAVVRASELLLQSDGGRTGRAVSPPP